MKGVSGDQEGYSENVLMKASLPAELNFVPKLALKCRQCEPGMMVHISNPSTQEAEVDWSL